MAKLSTTTKSSDSRNQRIQANKERRIQKCANKLAKRKAWRLKKYGDYPTAQLMKQSLVLFKKWGHRQDDCSNAIRTRRYKNSKPFGKK